MFKEGQFYAIQGQTVDGNWVYLESSVSSSDPRYRLRQIAKRASRFNDYNDYDSYSVADVKSSETPFGVRLFQHGEIATMVNHMRRIRKEAGSVEVDPNSLRIVVVESSVKTFIPEPESNDEIQLRSFALEKLSQVEKDLLKVVHWEVYHKLNDRSMLEDEEDEKD